MLIVISAWKIDVEPGITLESELSRLTARMLVCPGWYSTCPKFQFCSYMMLLALTEYISKLSESSAVLGITFDNTICR
jgi:hypothetical protein